MERVFEDIERQCVGGSGEVLLVGGWFGHCNCRLV